MRLVKRSVRVWISQRLLDDLNVVEVLGILAPVLDAASYLLYKHVESDVQVAIACNQLLVDSLYSEEFDNIVFDPGVEVDSQVIQVNGEKVFAVLVVEQLVHQFHDAVLIQGVNAREVQVRAPAHVLTFDEIDESIREVFVVVAILQVCVRVEFVVIIMVVKARALIFIIWLQISKYFTLLSVHILTFKVI